MTVTSYINSGNSFPIILEYQDKKYFVKLRAGMSGKYAIVAEWMGDQLGLQLGIKTQVPHWIELDSDIEFQNIHIEVRELVMKSLGINIGFDYQAAAITVNKIEQHRLSQQEANEIFLLDLLMINIDRTTGNLNLMSVNDEIISVDYESSLLPLALLENKNLLADNRILACLKNNPLYQEIDDDVINKFISKTEKINFKKILTEIPLSILNESERKILLQGINIKQENNWSLKNIMSELKELEVETSAARRRRIKKNEEDFRKRMQ